MLQGARSLLLDERHGQEKDVHDECGQEESSNVGVGPSSLVVPSPPSSKEVRKDPQGGDRDIEG